MEPDQIAGEIENCKRMLLDLKRTINKVSNENAKKPEITAENKTFKEKLQIESILPAIRKDKKRVRIVFWEGRIYGTQWHLSGQLLHRMIIMT